MIISILYTFFYALCGLSAAKALFTHLKIEERVWLGLVLGLLAMCWAPSIFAFITQKFGYLEHICGLTVTLILTFFAKVFYGNKKQVSLKIHVTDLKPLLFLLPVLIIGIYLFHTHILQEKNGALYVGQTTYGDLAMHLGFISSIPTQGTFPPEYSIFPGHAINYPFLCEIPSSSLFLFGVPLRIAYLFPCIYAYFLVILGVYYFFLTWLKKPVRAIFAFYLFFVGGGFGFVYFWDGLKGSSTVAYKINEYFSTNLQQLLEGYYTAPTNLPALGLRWVNPVIDMLIPQRATLFGWAVLFPCLKLLHDFTFEKKDKSLCPLIILSGLLPLIHTHSFLALGVISFVYCIYDIFVSKSKRLKQWIIYGLSAVAIACPQLFGFAFRQAGESGMVHLHFNWANELDSWLWFYLKNWGMLFVAFFAGILLLGKKTRLIISGPFILWMLSEIFVFQPNTYDNNKLIFVFFAYLCGLTSKLICFVCHSLNNRFQMDTININRSLSLTSLILSLFYAFYSLGVFISSANGIINHSHLTTLVFLNLALFYFAVKSIMVQKRRCLSIIIALSALCFCGSLLHIIIINRSTVAFSFTKEMQIIIIAAAFLNLCLSLINHISFRKKFSFRGDYILSCICGLVVTICLFSSGIMTYARETRTSYMAFSKDDVENAEFIKKQTDANAVFLTDSNWHLNPVSVLAGRTIVCGPDLYLYYHGIDTTERKNDVKKMFESPDTSALLFQHYNVSYVYIGYNEHNSYDINEEWFIKNCDLFFKNTSASIYKLKKEEA